MNPDFKKALGYILAAFDAGWTTEEDLCVSISKLMSDRNVICGTDITQVLAA